MVTTLYSQSVEWAWEEELSSATGRKTLALPRRLRGSRLGSRSAPGPQARRERVPSAVPLHVAAETSGRLAGLPPPLPD